MSTSYSATTTTPTCWLARCLEFSKFAAIKFCRRTGKQICVARWRELKAEIVEKGNRMEVLNKTLDGLKLNFDTLTAERDELNAKISSLVAMEEHLHKLHVEHVELVSACEEARKQAENQARRLREMEEEVEKQRVVIIDAAEEKREAIRQLCFSMEHYRKNYDELRNAFLGHRKQAPSPV